MKTLNTTALNDNQIIWFVRITDGTNTYRLATETIVLDNTWDGDALNTTQSRFSLNEVGKRINLVEGGTIGQVAAVTFGFKRNASNSLLADFFNEFYPATSGKVLSAQKVEIGIGWQGMTLDSEITWIQTYSVVDYVYDQSSIYLTCIEVLRLDAITLPYYEVQKEVDNGISYYDNAPDENYGLGVPLLYGDFTLQANEGTTKQIVSPLPKAILVDKTLYKFKIASHECNTNADLYQHINELNIKQSLDGFDITGSPSQVSAKTTGNSGTEFTMFNGDNGTICGGVIMYPTMPGMQTAIKDFKFDSYNGLTPYKLDAGDVISFKFPNYQNSPKLGAFNNETQVQLKIDFTNTVNPPGGSNNIQIKTYDSEPSLIDTLNTIVTLSETKTIDYTSLFIIQSWDFNKVGGLEFRIENLYVNPGDYIWINKIYLYCYYYYAKGNYTVLKKDILEYTSRYFIFIPIETRTRTRYKKQSLTADFFGDTDALAALKGREF